MKEFKGIESRILKDFKGTKGEWSKLLIEFDDYDLLAVGCKGEEVIAQLTFGGKATEERKANAQLIATSKELLVELYRMCLLVKSLPKIDEEMTERVKSAEKVIEKALGL